LTTEDNATSALAAVKLSDKKKSARDEKDMRFKRKNNRQGKIAVECFYCKKKGLFARDIATNRRETKNVSLKGQIAKTVRLS